jgi:hypothetical protein
LKVPTAVGDPEIVITLADQEAVTPAGKPELIVSIPVAPVVAIVISVKAVFTTSVGDDDGAAAVFAVHDESLRQRMDKPNDLSLKLLFTSPSYLYIWAFLPPSVALQKKARFLILLKLPSLKRLPPGRAVKPLELFAPVFGEFHRELVDFILPPTEPVGATVFR